ncbi:hypothetical protein, partial [Thiolapillus sp.]
KLVAAPYLSPNDWTPRLDAYFASPLALCARRASSAASRLLGTTSLRFALHGWQRMTHCAVKKDCRWCQANRRISDFDARGKRSDPLLPGQRWQSQCFQAAVVPFLRHGTLVLQRL